MMTTLAMNLVAVLWSVFIERSWLRPPGNCVDHTAIDLPAIMLLIIVKFTCGHRESRRLCACVQDANTVNTHVTSHISDEETASLCRPSEAKSFHLNGQGTSQMPVRQSTDSRKQTPKECQWHSSLDAVDKFMFLASLVFLALCIFTSLVIVPAKQGYYF